LSEEIEKLRKFKKESGWSLEQIAFEIGVTTFAVFNWLKGRFKPNSKSCEKIRIFLNNRREF